MLLRMGPFVPEDLNVVILFHFGPEDGHTCDDAEFEWYINDIFQADLNFNNASTGEEVFQGPFAMNLRQYLKADLCSPFDFSFVGKKTRPDQVRWHEGAAFDFTWSTGNMKTWYINTSVPTKFTTCELSSALSDPP